MTTPGVAETIESPDVWAQLRRELEDVGISPVVVEENSEYIAQWIKAALAQGLMDEDDPTLVEQPLQLPLLADSAYGGSPIFSAAALGVADEEFREEFRRKQSGRPIEEIFKPLTVEVTEPSTRKVSLTDPTRLIKKLFVKSTAIIEAASDGDIEKVAKLLSLGCNVNATERWGYAKLSPTCFCEPALVFTDNYRAVTNTPGLGGRHSACALMAGISPLLDFSWNMVRTWTLSTSTATRRCESPRRAGIRN